MTDRRRDGSDSVDCYASERSSRLDRKYVERVDGEIAQDVSEIQLRRDAMTTLLCPTISPRHFHNYQKQPQANSFDMLALVISNNFFP